MDSAKHFFLQKINYIFECQNTIFLICSAISWQGKPRMQEMTANHHLVKHGLLQSKEEEKTSFQQI